ncbi:WD40-repeat-containing domain protein [Catenaria anguillulae PL171]|uniref:WD40-repeat-containing domain protein n=1 Tax=Catenaria anguillulae PL171 TaxID=765915 RepID=A0A1Y2HKC5_9FUNG|nr:WD40-repeat-containing domain protein [Catenaria anguillulae PL171]
MISTTATTLSTLPTELVLASLGWLDDPRDLARCRSVSRAFQHLVDSHHLPLLSSVLRRSPLHASVASPLPESLDALREMHLLRRHGRSASSTPVADCAVTSILVPNGHQPINAQDQQQPVLPVAALPRPVPATQAYASHQATAFIACSSRSYTDTVQIPGTPVLLCSTRNQTSPLAALHVSCVTQQPTSTAQPNSTAYKVAIALPLPAQDAHTELVGTMAAHPSGKPLVATGSIDGTVKLWTASCLDVEADAWAVECMATFRHHRGWAAAVCLSNELLVSSGPDNEVHVYALAAIRDALEPLARIQVPIPSDTPFGIFGASISPSGKHLVVMDLDGVAYLYQAGARNPASFDLKCELLERLTLREARHFEANVRQSFGCLVQVTDHCVFVNSVRVGQVNVHDVWTGEVLYSLSIPTFNPPRSRTVHSFRVVTPSASFSFASNLSGGFVGLLVTTCAGDLHCFDYSNTKNALPSSTSYGVMMPGRWRIAPAILTSSLPAAASSPAVPGSAEQEGHGIEVEDEDDDEYADMPPLMSPTHLEDSHEFDFGSTSSSPAVGNGRVEAADDKRVNRAVGNKASGHLVVTPRGLRDQDLRNVDVDVDESVAAHVWGLVV